MRYITALLLIAFVGLAAWNVALQRQVKTALGRSEESMAAHDALAKDLAALESSRKTEHHYELRAVGFRMFRFDPATGDTSVHDEGGLEKV